MAMVAACLYRNGEHRTGSDDQPLRLRRSRAISSGLGSWSLTQNRWRGSIPEREQARRLLHLQGQVIRFQRNVFNLSEIKVICYDESETEEFSAAVVKLSVGESGKLVSVGHIPRPQVLRRPETDFQRTSFPYPWAAGKGRPLESMTSLRSARCRP